MELNTSDFLATPQLLSRLLEQPLTSLDINFHQESSILPYLSSLLSLAPRLSHLNVRLVPYADLPSFQLFIENCTTLSSFSSYITTIELVVPWLPKPLDELELTPGVSTSELNELVVLLRTDVLALSRLRKVQLSMERQDLNLYDPDGVVEIECGTRGIEVVYLEDQKRRVRGTGVKR